MCMYCFYVVILIVGLWLFNAYYFKPYLTVGCCAYRDTGEALTKHVSVKKERVKWISVSFVVTSHLTDGRIVLLCASARLCS